MTNRGINGGESTSKDEVWRARQESGAANLNGFGEAFNKAKAIYAPCGQGTEWTEPGQGATWRAIDAALDAIGKDLAGSWSRTEQEQSYRTNLSLTGAPLTADDVQNIGRAK